MNVLGDLFEVRFDSNTSTVAITKLGDLEMTDPLITIRDEYLATMPLRQAAEFLGLRLLLLNPRMRKIFESEFHPDTRD